MAAAAASKPTSKRAPTAASAPAPVIPAPVPEPEPEPERVPEATYSVTLRLQQAAVTGDSEYHLTWPASLVRRYLADELVKVVVPLRGHIGQPPPDALRFVQMCNVVEVIIFNWPERDVLA